MAPVAQRVIDEYLQGGWEVAYIDGSSETNPQVGMVGWYGVYCKDHRDTVAPLPIAEQQTNDRGELRVALHAIRSRNQTRRTLICSNSQMVVLGATGKASKSQRYDWHGGAMVGHVDFQEQLLHEIEKGGAIVRWLHVSSHVVERGNAKADTLADMGRRRSPLLKGLVTTARREQPITHDDD